jgi:uroporphyrinogen-III synthase
VDIDDVVLTQPAARVGPIVRRLESEGLRVTCWPLMDASAEASLDWHATFRGIAASRWTIFPSPASLALVFGAAAERGLEWPLSAGIALVGPGSQEELVRWHARVPGLAAAPCIEPASGPYDAGALLAHPALQELSGVRITVMRRPDGNRDWIAALRERGASVDEVIAYRVTLVDPPAGAAQWLAARRSAGAGLAWSIGSAAAGRRLAEWALGQSPPLGAWVLDQPVLTVHPRIVQALEASGWQRVRQHRPGLDGLVGAVESLRSDQP